MDTLPNTTPTAGRRLCIDLGWTRLVPPTIVDRRHGSVGSREARCEHHGPFTAILWALQPECRGIPPFWSSCPTCDGALQLEADARDAAIKGGTVDAKAAMVAALVRSAGIPERFKESTLWNWSHAMDQQRRVWEWARQWVGALDIALQTGRSAVFAGAPGTGKTHLAIGMLRHVVEKGGTGLYVTVMGMLGRIKDTYNSNATETEAKVVEQLASVDLLVMDEVGRSLDTNYESAQFFRILDLRYQRCRPTVLVTNLTRDAFIKFVGDAMADRLRESGGALMVFDWASQRSSKIKKEENDA